MALVVSSEGRRPGSRFATIGATGPSSGQGRAGLLEQLLARPAWMRDALCKEHPAVDFFPAKGDVPAAAKAVCGRCVVREECLAYALEHDVGQGHGVWGGTSARERRRLREAANRRSA